MSQHFARLSSSARLRRALKVLQEAGGEISTLELMRRANICAVSSVVSELRFNGAEIICRQCAQNGERRFLYTLIKSPKGY